MPRIALSRPQYVLGPHPRHHQVPRTPILGISQMRRFLAGITACAPLHRLLAPKENAQQEETRCHRKPTECAPSHSVSPQAFSTVPFQSSRTFRESETLLS